jgi:hypothetical protein
MRRARPSSARSCFIRSAAAGSAAGYSGLIAASVCTTIAAVLGVNAGVVLALSIALVLVRRLARLDRA